MKTKEAADLLVKFLRQSRQLKNRYRAAMLLRRMDTAYAREQLQYILSNPGNSSRLKKIVLTAYQFCGDASDVPFLQKWLATPEAEGHSRQGKWVIRQLAKRGKRVRRGNS